MHSGRVECMQRRALPVASGSVQPDRCLIGLFHGESLAPIRTDQAALPRARGTVESPFIDWSFCDSLAFGGSSTDSPGSIVCRFKLAGGGAFGCGVAGYRVDPGPSGVVAERADGGGAHWVVGRERALGFLCDRRSLRPAAVPSRVRHHALAGVVLRARADLGGRSVEHTRPGQAGFGGASKHPNHGYHLLGFSVLLVVVMAMAIEPFASTGHRYWLWGETRLPVTWQGVPLSCLFAWGAVSVIASFAATPFLIDKHPRPIPPSREPAWIWALLNGLFALGAAVHGLWPATILAGVSGAFAVVVLILARRQPAKRPPDRLALSPS